MVKLSGCSNSSKLGSNTLQTVSFSRFGDGIAGQGGCGNLLKRSEKQARPNLDGKNQISMASIIRKNQHVGMIRFMGGDSTTGDSEGHALDVGSSPKRNSDRESRGRKENHPRA
jgi:hypothetical protein